MQTKKNRFSYLIKPLHLLTDLCALVLVTKLISDYEFFNLHFLSYVTIFWTVSSLLTKHYLIYRFTNELNVLSLYFKQIVVFSFGFFAYFGIFKEGQVVNNQFKTLLLIALFTAFTRFLFYFSLKLYRLKGNNYRKAIVLGNNDSVKMIIKLLQEKKSYGIRYQGFFSNKKKKNSLGTFYESFDYVLNNEIDDIYCSIPEHSTKEMNRLTKFANTNNISLKFIPDYGQLYSKNRKVQYYDNRLIVIDAGKLPFQHYENIVVKRVFDVFFSLLVCLLVMPWLYPFLWVLIKLESKGSVIFKQKREGLHGKEFVCYKFRSMKLSSGKSSKHTSKNDPRITKIGAFIRKTSLDETPQFFNVLIGNMSVVGPRPHVEAFSIRYKKEVTEENYIKRYAMKPGITGLAQISGYRGEVKEYYDIKNRIRLDLFYIENWSFLLDIKIILMTVINVFKGEEKAY